MKIIIIANNTSSFNELMNDYKIDVINYNEFCNERSTTETWDSYNDYYCHLLCCRIRTESEHSKILLLVSNDLEHKALLVFHALIEINKNIAVALFYNEIPEDLRLEDDYGLFKNYFIKQHKLSLIKEKLENNTIDSIYNDFIDEFNYRDLIENYIYPKYFDHHQASNEWGATVLLRHHGIEDSVIQTECDIPKTLFYLIKQKQFENSKSNDIPILEDDLIRFKSNILNYKNILLIDDNSHRGWVYALQKFFISSTSIISKKSKEELYEKNELINLSEFDLIFLDLRIPIKYGDRPDMEIGFSILDDIKNICNYPHIPVVILTASQKARTLNEVLKKGADEMCVKPSPDDSIDQSYLNYVNLIKSINNVSDKYKILRAYWNSIVNIKTNLLPEINDSSEGKFKSRINERLEMFYGLLKKEFEQWDYDINNFYYSSNELAFMTLWSILNDIQEAYFKKGNGLSYTKIKDFNTNPHSFVNIELDNWKIKDQLPEKYFIVEKPIIEEDINPSGNRQRPNKDYIRRDLYSDFQITRNPPYFEFDPKGFQYRKVNYKDKLSLQIAFLIFSKQSLAASVNKNEFATFLKDLNEIRNKLFLTHGETSSDFYTETLRNNKDPNMNCGKDGHIEKLFNLIAFLLSGKDIKVNL